MYGYLPHRENQFKITFRSHHAQRSLSHANEMRGEKLNWTRKGKQAEDDLHLNACVGQQTSCAEAKIKDFETNYFAHNILM